MSAFAISQILIGIAFLFDLASFQFKKREITLLCFTASAILISIHYFLLDATTAGIVIGIGAMRYLVSIYTQHVAVKWLAVITMLALGTYTFDAAEDVLAIAATIFGTFAAFQPDQRKFRIIAMLGTLCLITFNTLIWTPAGIALELFFLGSNLVSYYRFYLRK